MINAKVIILLALATTTLSDSSDYIAKFTIRCNAKWTEFTNAVLQNLVSGKIFTHQQAINFLKTFGKNSVMKSGEP